MKKVTFLFLSFCFITISMISNVYGHYNLKDSIANCPANFISPTYFHRSGYSVNVVPNPKKGSANGYVSDPDNYINPTDEYEINKILCEIERKTTVQVSVVVLNSIKDEVPKDFAVKLFEKWGIGYADKDNGLLILTVIDQRRTEFEVGYGLEPILTDLICHRIGTDEIVPFFKQAKYGKGLINAVNKVKLIIENPDVINEIYSQKIDFGDKIIDYGASVIGFTSFTDYKKEIISLSPLQSTKSFLVWLYLLITGIIIFIDYQRLKFIDHSKEDFYDKYKDVCELKDDKLGCLTFVITLLFPLSYFFFNQKIKKRLKKYRFSPRFSRVNGKKMFLKDEWKENKFLEEANILEEKLRSVRYDVWVTEDESDVMILVYEGTNEKYSKCKECGYKTFGLYKTEVFKKPTYKSNGSRKVFHLCKNCHHSTSSIERSRSELVIKCACKVK